MLGGERCIQQTRLCRLRQRAKERSGCKPASRSLPPAAAFPCRLFGGASLSVPTKGASQGKVSCSGSSSESRLQTKPFRKSLCTCGSSSGGTTTAQVLPGKALASLFIPFPCRDAGSFSNSDC